ncbi:unnamed protein product, partial [Ixodes hexagonus]
TVPVAKLNIFSGYRSVKVSRSQSNKTFSVSFPGTDMTTASTGGTVSETTREGV